MVMKTSQTIKTIQMIFSGLSPLVMLLYAFNCECNVQADI